MIEGNPIPIDETASAARTQADHDFSTLHGFQLAGARASDGGEGRGDDAWRVALKLELEARGARLHQAVDASIVLANDGAIRWLGDPVARLAPGPDLLTPRAVILADDSLPETARELVAARLDLWLTATTRRLLAPLFELQDLQDEPGPVRDLGFKIVRSLGVLDRDPIRGQVRALDQNARKALRKRGVRFGAYYIYIPTLLKPAARVLALHLWKLQTPAVSAAEIAGDLAPLASSGRTSLPCDRLISRESYRAAGFRRCGDRIVRIDIVERLADMIRAAIVKSPSEVDEGKKTQSVSGFLVTGQMTSLTGCSGEQFASILKSLGFESIEIRRSELAGRLAAPSPPATNSPSSLNIDQSRGLPDENSHPSREEISDQGEATGSDGQNALQLATLAADAATEGAHGGAVSSADRQEAAPAALTPRDFRSSEDKAADLEETIMLWRPAPRPRPPNRREQRHPQNRNGPAENELSATAQRRTDRAGRGHPVGGSGDRIDRPPAEGASSLEGENREIVATDVSVAAHRSNRKRTNKKRRQTAGNGDMFSGRPNSGLQQKAPVDPNSPFAKLVELRSLLEAQSKNRP